MWHYMYLLCDFPNPVCIFTLTHLCSEKLSWCLWCHGAVLRQSSREIQGSCRHSHWENPRLLSRMRFARALSPTYQLLSLSGTGVCIFKQLNIAGLVLAVSKPSVSVWRVPRARVSEHFVPSRWQCSWGLWEMWDEPNQMEVGKDRA